MIIKTRSGWWLNTDKIAAIQPLTMAGWDECGCRVWFSGVEHPADYHNFDETADELAAIINNKQEAAA